MKKYRLLLNEQEIDLIRAATRRFIHDTETVIEAWEENEGVAPDYLHTRYAELKDLWKKLLSLLNENQIDIITDLLIEFDEMGFAPTTVCPDPDSYAVEWKRKLTEALENC